MASKQTEKQIWWNALVAAVFAGIAWVRKKWGGKG